MDKTSSYKLLKLINMLYDSEYSKNEIIEQFQKTNIKVTKPLINHYIQQCYEYKIEIKTKTNQKRENIYYIEKPEENLEFKEEELAVISDLKKLLTVQKDYSKIRKTMRLFYKIAKFIKDKDIQREFINFGYYSTINWYLVQELEKHCKEKNVISIEYILPQGKSKTITIHVDSVKVSDWSHRLYLHGIFINSNHFSHLPIDRIFMIKNVIERNKQINVATDTLTYVVSKNIYKEMFVDSKEKIINDDGQNLTIERPIDDDFYILQRLMTFCPNIFYISDERIRGLFQEKLKILKESYKNGIN